MKIELGRNYLHEELLKAGYEVEDMEINEESSRYEAVITKDNEKIAKVFDVGNENWRVIEVY